MRLPKPRGWAGQLGYTQNLSSHLQLSLSAHPVAARRTHWDARLLQDLLPVGAISSLQRDIYGLGIASGQSELGWVWQPPWAKQVGFGILQTGESWAALPAILPTCLA